MRIGIITGEYPPMQGGVGAYTQILARYIAHAGHDVFIFSNEQAEEEEKSIHLTNTAANWNFGTVRAIKHWVRENNLDLVNIQFQTAAYDMSAWLHFLPQLLPVPVITTFHDLRFPYLFPKAGKIRDWIVMHLARQSAGVIVTNHEDYARVNHLPCVQLIPIGSNIATQLPENYNMYTWREQHNINPETTLLAYFGFINESKGVDTLLHALSQLKDDLDIKLIMIGGRTGASDPTNAAYSSKIDSLIEQLNLTDHVLWTGFLPDEQVSAWLKTASLVVLPFRDGASFRRGSLMAAIEHECAIITTRPQAEIPAFQHGNNMFLVPPDNPEQLTDAIRTVSKSTDFGAKLRVGASRLRLEFQWEPITNDTIALFEQVLA